jgi:hypothetical protein
VRSLRIDDLREARALGVQNVHQFFVSVVLERPGELSLNAASQLQQLIFVHLVAPSAEYHAPVGRGLHDFEAKSVIAHKKDAELGTGEGRADPSACIPPPTGSGLAGAPIAARRMADRRRIGAERAATFPITQSSEWLVVLNRPSGATTAALERRRVR